MRHIHVAASAIIDVPAATLYATLSDYRNGHPTLLPTAYFRDLVVEQGGQGAGTIINFRAGMGSAMRPYRMIVEEPEPGRVLLERDLAPSGTLVTRFILTPQDAGRTKLEITTDWDAPTGLGGFLESLITPAIYRRVYRVELRQIARVLAPKQTYAAA